MDKNAIIKELLDFKINSIMIDLIDKLELYKNENSKLTNDIFVIKKKLYELTQTTSFKVEHSKEIVENI